MAHLNAEQVRRLDALNLIRAYGATREDSAAAAEIIALYTTRESCAELVASMASLAAHLLPDHLLTMYREFMLGGSE